MSFTKKLLLRSLESKGPISQSGSIHGRLLSRLRSEADCNKEQQIQSKQQAKRIPQIKQNINFRIVSRQRAFFGKESSPKKQYDLQQQTDRNGNYIVQIGQIVNSRYTIQTKIGQGSYGQVFLAMDSLTNKQIVLKIYKYGQNFQRIAQKEVEIINQLSPNYYIVNIIHSFDFCNHSVSFIQILVQEFLGQNLHQYRMRQNKAQVLLSNIKVLFKQMVLGLQHIHSKGIIHCDFKPENIQIYDTDSLAIKIIDFNSAAIGNTQQEFYIQSRHYRAPEIILEMDYDNSIDIWSLGCILFELATGQVLFQGVSSLNQIQLIASAIGNPDIGLIQKSKKSYLFFDTNGEILQAWQGESKFQLINNLQPELKELICSNIQTVCIQWDPSKRPTASEILRHHLFSRFNRLRLTINAL